MCILYLVSTELDEERGWATAAITFEPIWDHFLGKRSLYGGLDGSKLASGRRADVRCRYDEEKQH